MTPAPALVTLSSLILLERIPFLLKVKYNVQGLKNSETPFVYM